MSKFLSSMAVFGRRTSRAVGSSTEGAHARRRFRNSMPGELGLCAAVRLYGVGR